MQKTLSGSVVPAQRQHAAAPIAEPAPALSTAGRDVVVERRRGGLPHHVRWLVVLLDALAVVAAVALAWPLRALVPGLATATRDWVLYSLAVSPLLLALWIGFLAACGT